MRRYLDPDCVAVNGTHASPSTPRPRARESAQLDQRGEFLTGVPTQLESFGIVDSVLRLLITQLSRNHGISCAADNFRGIRVINVRRHDVRERDRRRSCTTPRSRSNRIATSVSVTSAASTTRRRRTSGSASSMRNETRAASDRAAYSSDSASSSTYHSRSPGVTAKASLGADPSTPSATSTFKSADVAGGINPHGPTLIYARHGGPYRAVHRLRIPPPRSPRPTLRSNPRSKDASTSTSGIVSRSALRP